MRPHKDDYLSRKPQKSRLNFNLIDSKPVFVRETISMSIIAHETQIKGLNFSCTGRFMVPTPCKNIQIHTNAMKLNPLISDFGTCSTLRELICTFY